MKSGMPLVPSSLFLALQCATTGRAKSSSRVVESCAPLAGGAPVAQVVVAERQVAAAGKVGANDVKVAPQVGTVAVGYVQQGPEVDEKCYAI